MQRQIFHAYSDKEQVQQNMKYNIQDREEMGQMGHVLLTANGKVWRFKEKK